MVVALVSIGIAASLLAYAVSPGVRHAVGHAAHSVKNGVSKVFDHDSAAKKDDHSSSKTTPAGTAPAGAPRSTGSAAAAGAAAADGTSAPPG